jgi:ABC-type sugar transport system ATPase subunit
MTEERPRPLLDAGPSRDAPDDFAGRSPESPPLITLENVTKDYPGVRALDGVTLDLRPGEVHALIGENGAGKSTLIRIMSGDMQPDLGAIYVRGVETRFRAPSGARQAGIATIYQELMIVPGMTVAENIVLGDEPGIGPSRQCYSRRQAERLADEVLHRLGERAAINPRAVADRLSTGQRQIVEIARALVRRAPVIILDEPTAALSDKETKALLDILRQLRSEGAAILFVSHRLEEVRSIADRITVLRGGRHIATLDSNEVRHTGQLIALMVGRALADLFPPRNESIGDMMFSVRGFTRQGAFEDVSFDVRAGEVLGFAGLIGAGRTEVMRAVFGADPYDRGTVTKRERRLNIRAPSDAIAAGIAYLPEDRKDDGLVLLLSGYENLVMASLGRHSKLGVVSWPSIRSTADAVARRLQFRGNLEEPARTNSGGNQQKLVLGKWILSHADVFIFDEPTRGIDVGAKLEVYRLVHELAARGAAIIVISSETGELINLCHRILVMSGGRICDEMNMEEFDEHRILAAAFTAHIAERGSAQQPAPV